jgi:hypothetical protein
MFRFLQIPAVPADCELVFRKPVGEDILDFHCVLSDIVRECNARGRGQIQMKMLPIVEAPFRWVVSSESGHSFEFRIRFDDTNTLDLIFHEPFAEEFRFLIFYDNIPFSIRYALAGFNCEKQATDEWGLDLCNE